MYQCFVVLKITSQNEALFWYLFLLKLKFSKNLILPDVVKTNTCLVGCCLFLGFLVCKLVTSYFTMRWAPNEGDLATLVIKGRKNVSFISLFQEKVPDSHEDRLVVNAICLFRCWFSSVKIFSAFFAAFISAWKVEHHLPATCHKNGGLSSYLDGHLWDYDSASDCSVTVYRRTICVDDEIEWASDFIKLLRRTSFVFVYVTRVGCFNPKDVFFCLPPTRQYKKTNK